MENSVENALNATPAPWVPVDGSQSMRSPSAPGLAAAAQTRRVRPLVSLMQLRAPLGNWRKPERAERRAAVEEG